MKQLLKSYTQLIAITSDHSRLGVQNKFFPSQMAYLPTYITFIL